jgi:hypothetical protein
MSPRVAQSCAIALIPSVITLLLVQACGGSLDAIAQAQPPAFADPVEGVWQSNVSQLNCSTGAVVSTFQSTQVFHRGGTFGDTSSHGPATRGPAFGTWTRNGATYTVKFRFFRYNADGSLAGSSVSTMTASLSADGSTLTATRNTQVLDPTGTQVATVCASDNASRLL